MAKRVQLDGPPWGTHVDEDEAYIRGQARSAGSGLLGGWSFDAYGGSIAETPRQAAEEELAEIHRLLDEREDETREDETREDETND